MKRIQFYLCLLLGCLVTFPLYAAPEAEYGKLSKTYILREDGSQEWRVQKELTLFTHTAMNGLYGETFISYDPQYQTLKINDSYTRQKDGTIVRTPANAFVEVLPSAAAGAPAYNRLKEMVVVHTALELGATVYLDYTITSKPGYLPALDVCDRLDERSPIKEYTFKVSVPQGKAIHYAVLNEQAVPADEQENSMRTLTWRLRNVPACPAYADMRAGDIPLIAVSTFSSSAEAMGYVKKQFVAGDESVLSAKVRELIADAGNDAEKSAAIDRYVNGLGICRLSLSATGYRLRPASEVVRTAYGTEVEKVNLQAQCYRLAGLKPEVKACFIKTDRPEHLGLSTLQTFFIHENNSLCGYRDYQTVLDLDGKQVSLPEASFKVERQEQLSLSYAVKVGRQYKMLTLPSLSSPFAGRVSAMSLNTTRTVNLLLPSLVDETYTCTIQIPEGTSLVTSEKEEVIENKIGSVSFSIKKVSAQEVQAVCRIRMKQQLIDKEDYPKFYRLVSEWTDRNNHTLLFK